MVLTTSLVTQISSDIQTDLEALFTHGAVGSDTTIPTSGDTALGSEDFRDAIDSFDTSSSDKITASLRILTTENNGNSIAEFGWFNAAGAGTMWSRNTMTAIAKTSDIQVYLDTAIAITISQ